MKNLDETISQALGENLKEQPSIGFKEIWNTYSKKRHTFNYKTIMCAATSLLLLIGINYYAYTKGIWFNESNMQIKYNNSVINSSSSAALLIWGDKIYYMSMIEVPYDKVGKEIGEITSKEITSKEINPKHNGESNDCFAGTKLHKIKGVDTKQIIALECLRNYNRTLDLNVFKDINCDCKKDWVDECSSGKSYSDDIVLSLINEIKGEIENRLNNSRK